MNWDAHTKSLKSVDWTSWAAIPIRLAVGYGFAAHGYAKLAHGPENFVSILVTLGIPLPQFMAWLTILTELVGGIAVLLGAFIPYIAVPMAAVLVVAAVTVHLPYGFSSIKLQAITPSGAQFGRPGYELDVVYLACLLTLVLTGPGPFAIANLFSRAKVKTACPACD